MVDILSCQQMLQECSDSCQQQLADLNFRLNSAYGWMTAISFITVLWMAWAYRFRREHFDRNIKWAIVILILSTGWLMERFISRMVWGG